MREIRLSGSEGGGGRASPYPNPSGNVESCQGCGRTAVRPYSLVPDRRTRSHRGDDDQRQVVVEIAAAERGDFAGKDVLQCLGREVAVGHDRGDDALVAEFLFASPRLGGAVREEHEAVTRGQGHALAAVRLG